MAKSLPAKVKVSVKTSHFPVANLCLHFFGRVGIMKFCTCILLHSFALCTVFILIKCRFLTFLEGLVVGSLWWRVTAVRVALQTCPPGCPSHSRLLRHSLEMMTIVGDEVFVVMIL